MDKITTRKFKASVLKSISFCFSLFSIGTFAYFTKFDYVKSFWAWGIVIMLEMLAIVINTVFDD